jgi:pentatricopeptide repeat protein
LLKEAPPTGQLFSTALDHSDPAPNSELRKAIVGQLVKKDFAKAKQLLARYTPLDSFWHSKHLFIESCAGNIAKAEQHFSALATPTKSEIRSLLTAYANSLDIPGLRNRFDELFAPNSPHQLRIEYFYPVFSAMARTSDPRHAQMKKWRKRLTQAGFEPDPFIYSVMVQYYSKHNMTAAVSDIFEEIRSRGTKVGIRVYQNGMTYFARWKDLDAVKALFQRVLMEGIKPDIHLYTTLMHAHAAVRDWKGVLEVRERMKIDGVDPDQSIVAFNILLKAAYSMGIPYHSIRSQFRSLQSSGLTANAHTYCIVAEAAIESKSLPDAFDCLHQMVDRNRTEPGFLNPHIFTILIDGCLRQGDAELASRVFSSMEDHGIRPTSLTFGKMLRGGARLPQDLQRAVWKTLEGAPMDKVPALGRSTWYEHIYVPQMRRALRSGSPSTVQDIHHHVMAIGLRPTLMMDFLLLDAYRQSLDAQGVKKLWHRLFKAALASRDAADALKTPKRRNEDTPPFEILAPALSICLDALSRGGLHASAIRIWNAYQTAGFKFDVHNWNHLVVALVRAGQVGVAFEVLEKVLMSTSTPQNPSRISPNLTYLFPQYTVAPKRTALGRRLFRERGITASRIARRHSTVSLDASDLLFSFKELVQHSKIENDFRVHHSLKLLLARVLWRLQTGFAIIPFPKRRNSRKLNFRLNSLTAARQLKTIMRWCPSAFAYIQNFSTSGTRFKFRDDTIPTARRFIIGRRRSTRKAKAKSIGEAAPKS